MEKSASNKSLLVLTLRTCFSHTTRTNPFPHSLDPLLSWYSCGRHLLTLRNKWHSEREYTAGICPWFPRLNRASTAQAWHGDMSPAWAVPNQPTPISLHWWVQIQEWTSAQGCTTSLILLMIGRLDFPFEETLTRVISTQTCRESSQSSTHPPWVNSEGLDPPGLMVINCRNVWCWRLKCWVA